MPEILINFYEAASIIDLIYIVITFLSLVKCYKKGFVLSILSMAKWFFAYVITLLIFPRAKPYFKNIVDNEYVLDVGLGVIIFVIVLFLVLMIKKGISFLLINHQSMDSKYFHPANYLPLLFFGITSLIGIILYKKKSSKYNYLLLVLLAYVGIFSLVAILPRYKLIILPLQIIFTSVFIEKIKNYYIDFKKNK